MSTILLRLAGPLQSWGAESRFTERKTRHEPTKSGVVGLLAAALGRSREEGIADLASLPMAVRIDQAGVYERDFQTARTRKYDKTSRAYVPDNSLPLSNRYYLADAVFVVGVVASDAMVDELAFAVEHPAFPLYLGRRSCAPSGRVLWGVAEGNDLMASLATCPWQATNRRLIFSNAKKRTVRCEVLRDRMGDGDAGVAAERVRDYPLSFSQLQRQYDWRVVAHDWVEAVNPHYIDAAVFEDHDPLAAIEEG